MRKTIISIFINILIAFGLNAQSVAINSTDAAADNSALLDLNSTDKGFLITRAEKTNIPAPAFGLMILAPSDSCLYIHNGAIWTVLGAVGANCPCGSSTPPSPPPSDCGTVTFTYKGATVTYGTVQSKTSPVRCWLDRNLGTAQAAISSSDIASYADSFQWGRLDDLHQNVTSATMTVFSATDVPGHGDFIVNSNPPFDWGSPQKSNIWQGVSEVNNPCPSGYRIPTEAEWHDEIQTWEALNATGAFTSPLKLTKAGLRFQNNGLFFQDGLSGAYWTSTVDPSNPARSRSVSFSDNNASSSALSHRTGGHSARCI